MSTTNTSQPSHADRISEIAFDLCSIGTILGLALNKLSDSNAYGRTETEDGAMMADVGQVLIDARKRLEGFNSELHQISGQMARG